MKIYWKTFWIAFAPKSLKYGSSAQSGSQWAYNPCPSQSLADNERQSSNELKAVRFRQTNGHRNRNSSDCDTQTISGQTFIVFTGLCLGSLFCSSYWSDPIIRLLLDPFTFDMTEGLKAIAGALVPRIRLVRGCHCLDGHHCRQSYHRCSVFRVVLTPNFIDDGTAISISILQLASRYCRCSDTVCDQTSGIKYHSIWVT